MPAFSSNAKARPRAPPLHNCIDHKILYCMALNSFKGFSNFYGEQRKGPRARPKSARPGIPQNPDAPQLLPNSIVDLGIHLLEEENFFLMHLTFDLFAGIQLNSQVV